LKYLKTGNQLNLDRITLKEPDAADLPARVEKVVERYAFYDSSKPISTAAPPQSEVPESVLQQMREWMTPEVLEYLQRRRGLQLETIQRWELGWMPSKRRLCVPIRQADGKLVSISGRLLVEDPVGRWTDDLPKPDEFDEGPRLLKYLHSEFRRNVVLYGMDKIDPFTRVGFLHEGFFQTIATSQAGYANALARMGTHLSGEQVEFLEKHFDHLVVVPDGDPAGRKSAKEIVERLSHRKKPIPKVTVSEMPEGKDADQLPVDHLRRILENSLTT
jgi:DNA primase